MTFLVKCDNCGKTQEADTFDKLEPCNPFNEEKGERWYSRTGEDKKTKHACCHDCIVDGGMVWPL